VVWVCVGWLVLWGGGGGGWGVCVGGVCPKRVRAKFSGEAGTATRSEKESLSSADGNPPQCRERIIPQNAEIESFFNGIGEKGRMGGPEWK